MKAAEPTTGYLFGRSGGDLLDVNVWLALAYDQHPKHQNALNYWYEQLADANTTLWFCRTTMLGLVRLLCQPQVMGSDVLRLDTAWQVYEAFSAEPQVKLIIEPSDVDAKLANLVNSTLPSKHLTDAYLFALAQAAGLRLVSFDGDFSKFAAPGSEDFLLLGGA